MTSSSCAVLRTNELPCYQPEGDQNQSSTLDLHGFSGFSFHHRIWARLRRGSVSSFWTSRPREPSGTSTLTSSLRLTWTSWRPCRGIWRWASGWTEVRKTRSPRSTWKVWPETSWRPSQTSGQQTDDMLLKGTHSLNYSEVFFHLFDAP